MKQNKEKSLKVENISKKYGDILAVDNISFETSKKEIVALLGPNGAGKSTLMNIISGFLSPTSGRVLVNGIDVAKFDLKTKKEIGFLPEGAPMYDDMKVELFLKYMIEMKLNLQETDIVKSADIKRIYNEEFLRIVEDAKIKDILCQKIETLSKGYLRRVGFAQSIIGNPPILLLDEPTDGLDPNQKDHLRGLIKNMSKEKTILISTHLLDEAKLIASRIIIINKGKIIIDGSLKDILKETKTKTLGEAFSLLTVKGE